LIGRGGGSRRGRHPWKRKFGVIKSHNEETQVKKRVKKGKRGERKGRM